MDINDIKNLSVISVMDRLGVQYFHKNGMEYGIKDGNDKTNGWSFNESKGYITDFSKDRSHGNVFTFVRDYLGLNDKQTYDRFNNEFGLTTISNKEVKEIKDFEKLFMSLPNLSDKQISYLDSRAIDYNKVKQYVKDYQGAISVRVNKLSSIGISCVGISARRLIDDPKTRFICALGTDGNSAYMGNIDYSKNHLFIVEGLFDFLTIAQYDGNVIGIRNNINGMDIVKELSKSFELIVINDNDEAGGKILDFLKGTNYKHLDLSMWGKQYKDINDFEKDMRIGDKLIETILKETKVVSPITSSLEKFLKIRDKYKKFGKLGFDSPYPLIDKLTSGIIAGKVYMLMGYSNTGKSKLSYWYVKKFLEIGKKVGYINLEVDEGFCMKNIMGTVFNKNDNELFDLLDYDMNKLSNLVIFDNIRSLDAIISKVKESNFEIVFIDYVQNITTGGGTDYEKHSKIAIGLQQLAIETGVTIFGLSQVSNESAKVADKPDSFVSPKGSGEYMSCSDVIFLIKKTKIDERPGLVFRIHKNKFGRASQDFFIKDIDWARGQFRTMIPKDEPDSF